MQDPPSQPVDERRPSWTIGDFALIWLGGLIGTTAFAALAASLDNGDWLVVFALAGQYVGNLATLWLIWSRKQRPGLGFQVEPRDAAYVGLGLLLQLVLALLLLPLAELLFPDGRPPQEIAEAIADAAGSGSLKVSLVLTAVVLAPVTEEILFRGVLLKALRKHSDRFVIVVTAAVFALIHILGLNFERIWASAALVLPPLFVLGLLLAWITLRTGRLGPAIFLHSGWNLLAALVLLIPADLLEEVNSATANFR